MYNVLIVDDEPAILEGLKLMLNFSDYGFSTVDSAENGEDALEILKKTRYNLLITDIRMPVMDGLELIKEVKRLSPDTRTIILSGYNEFSYAKKGIEYGVMGYLLKPINSDELIEHITNVKNALDNEFAEKIKRRNVSTIAKDRFFQDFISGHLLKKEIMDKSGEYGIETNAINFCVALIEINNFYKMVENNLENAKLLKFSVKNIIEEIVSERNMGYVYEEIEGFLGILACSSKLHLNYEELEDCFNHICSCVLKFLKINVTIGYGDFVKQTSQLKTCRKQALYAVERKFIVANSSIVAYNQVTVDESLFWHLEWDNQLLFDALESMDLRTVESEIDKLVNEITDKRVSGNTISSIIQNFIYSLCTIIKHNNGSADMLFTGINIQDMINNCANIEAFKASLLFVCSKASGYISELSKSKSVNIIDQIKKYIDENYTREISLKEISSIFYMNSAYLGQLFKNTVGEPFNDYLNRKRIAEVKRLIVSDIHKIHEVLEKVGYSNQGYFYKKFKLYEGISFAEYNEDLKKRKKDSVKTKDM